MKNYGFVKVAAAACQIRVADPVYNRNAIEKVLEECMEQKAKVVVFPQLCLSGATCQDLFWQDSLLAECRKQLELLIKKSSSWDALIFLGLPWKKGDLLYNVAAVLNRGRLLALIPKENILPGGQGIDGGCFTPAGEGEEWETILGERVFFGNQVLFQANENPLLTVACELGEDLWGINPPSVKTAAAGAKIIVNLTASPDMVGMGRRRARLVKETSRRLATAYVLANAGEGESTQDMVFAGDGLIVENGSLLAQAERFREETVYGQVDLDRLSKERGRRSLFTGNQKSVTILPFLISEEEEKLERKFSALPFVPENPEERESRCEEILAMQTAGLRQRYRHIGCRNAVIGISGGLDSTLALLVTVRAFDCLGLPRHRIRSVTMPCFGTTGRTYENACKLAKLLGTTLEEVDIKEAIRLHFRDIGQDEANHDVTYENSQARERTQVLMDLANRDNALVIGTGDLSELALGWATYNGDHMSMYGVNAGVPKTLVRHLVAHVAETCGEKELGEVLLDIVDTPVSPELLPPVEGAISQKTEDLVGPYELHDFFLYHILRWGYEPEKIYFLACHTFAGEYDGATVLKWLKTFYRRFFSQQFKRSCLPDGPKVGSVGLSPRGDLRMPSDASAAIWLSRLEKL